MQTLTSTTLEFRTANPSQTGIYANNEIIGLIQTHPELGPDRWEYRSYANWYQPFVGTYDECMALAESEYLDPPEPQHPQTPLLVHADNVREMKKAINEAKRSARPRIIWLKGMDLPAYWSEELTEQVMKAYREGTNYA